MLPQLEQALEWHRLFESYAGRMEKLSEEIQYGVLISGVGSPRQYRPQLDGLRNVANHLMRQYVTHLTLFQEWHRQYQSWPLVNEVSFKGVTQRCFDASGRLIDLDEIFVSVDEERHGRRKN